MSSKTYLRATLTFFEPSLRGGLLDEIAYSYRPLMNLVGEQRTSCHFERIGPGGGVMALGVPYEVLIKLTMRNSIEEHYGKSIHEFFPTDRDLTLTVIPERVVAEGKVIGIVEGAS